MVPQTTARMAQVRMRRKRSSADSTRRSSRTPRRAPACCNATACCNTLSLFPERHALLTSTDRPECLVAAATIPGAAAVREIAPAGLIVRHRSRAASSTRDRPGGTGPNGWLPCVALGHSLPAGCVHHRTCGLLCLVGAWPTQWCEEQCRTGAVAQVSQAAAGRCRTAATALSGNRCGSADGAQPAASSSVVQLACVSYI